MYICSIRDRGLAFGVSEGEEAMCRICIKKYIYIYILIMFHERGWFMIS